ncbi:MAG: hypothetical protein ACYTEQ_30200 [Planctomycetota bacterium]|jgi:hypothetical protein
MAEFLIRKEQSWMDDMSPGARKKWIESGEYNQEKFDARYRVGDIVQVKQDGRYGPHAHAGKFYHIKVPGLGISQALKYRDFHERLYTADERDLIAASQADKVEAKELADGRNFDRTAWISFYVSKLAAKKKILAKRHWNFDVASFPSLQTDPVLTITVAQFEAAISEKQLAVT